ncbi:MAG: DUF1643 domain-containing protein, partial [Sneathiella sp.]
FRATDPKDLKKAKDPVGPLNDAAIIKSANAAQMVICAWGGHGDHQNRHLQVRDLLRVNDITSHVLSLTKKGHPGHPLYIPYSKTPVAWTDF